MLSAAERYSGALWGIFFADALSMPVHWVYDIPELDRRYGRVTKYLPAGEHPKSYLRMPPQNPEIGKDIVGDVILKGKKQNWQAGGLHYHHGMQAGENTLNAQCARVTMRAITASNGSYNGDRFLADYVQFMTTEGSHNDTYAESYHRDFFANYAKGLPPNRCCGKEGHDTPSVGGLVTLTPVIISSLSQGEDRCVQTALEHLHWTHRAASLDRAAEAYIRLMYSLFHGASLREAVVKAGTAIGVDVPALAARGAKNDRAVVGGTVSTACYITDSMPAVLFLAYKYADNAQAAIEANTNCGGENCHRGSVLATIVGAAHGVNGFAKHMKTGLVEKDAIGRDIESFLEAVENK